jgi:hypothetical protein
MKNVQFRINSSEPRGGVFACIPAAPKEQAKWGRCLQRVTQKPALIVRIGATYQSLLQEDRFDERN